MSENTEFEAVEEQEIAAWVAYLNQLRKSNLANQLREIQIALNEAAKGQKQNLASALKSLQLAEDEIKKIIDTNRGSGKGVHGFIAEPAQTGIGNARQQILGKNAIWKWINDNKDWDLRQIDPQTGAEIPVQMKFTQSAKIINEITGKTNGLKDSLSLYSLLGHLQKYPDALKVGGKYMIPKDHYDTFIRLLNMSEYEANRLPSKTGELSLKNWKYVQEFVKNGKIPLDRIIPSDLSYADVQRDKVFDTLKKEKEAIKATSKQIENQQKAEAEAKESVARAESQPSWAEAAQVTAVSAAIESATAFLMTYLRLRREKKLDEFNAEDWKELGLKSGKGAVSGAIRGAAIYGLTNYTPVPASLASGLVTAILSVTELAYSYHKGSMDREEFIALTEAACMDAAVSSVSALVGEVLIPIPFLGPLIGTAVGRIVVEIAKGYCEESEQNTIIGCQKEFELTCTRFGEEYVALTARLDAQMSHYCSIMAFLLDEDANFAFYQSVNLAATVGVDPEKVLRTKKDIDDYFVN